MYESGGTAPVVLCLRTRNGNTFKNWNVKMFHCNCQCYNITKWL